MNNYETIIGIEVHAQLNTKRKIFSPSKNDEAAKPNTNIHPIDLGMPGALPRFNEEVLQKTLLVTKGLNMEVTKWMHWDRKNYFYHDNPKGYQITQYETPIGRNGYVELDSSKKIIIDFMHMEEDTAKSLHDSTGTLLDFNRSGVPLIEIVTAPVLRSGEEAREYLEKLRNILLYLDVTDGKMEDGSLRVDVNVSVRPYGQKEFNPKVEIKNLNSFSNVTSSIQKEVATQVRDLNSGIITKQATKRFNETKKQLDIMRIKEGTIDYRYMPEPDLAPIMLTDEYIAKATENMPLLPAQIKTKLQSFEILETKEINQLIANHDIVLFLLEAVDSGLDVKTMTNYLLVNIMGIMNKEHLKFAELKLTIEKFKELEEYLQSQKISTNHVKQILPIAATTDKTIGEIIKELKIEQITDEKQIGEIVEKILNANPESIEDYNNGKDRAFGFLIGQIMKETKGQASPQVVNKLLNEALKGN